MESMTLSNIIIIGLTIVAMAVPVFVYYKKENYGGRKALPNIVASLGVLGTFGGITYALFKFNANDMDTSVVDLLTGMKTAFFTSVIGMFSSIGMKIIKPSNLDVENDEDDIGPLILKELKIISSSIIESHEEMFRRMDEKEKRNLAKQEETTREIKLLNTDLNRKQDELISQFKAFAETMAEQNSKSLIEALKEVIRDFNTKINEQFGENFKELNRAVGKLLEWQENYKIHIEQTTDQLKITIDGIKNVESSMSCIAERANVMISLSQELIPVLEAVKSNQSDIKECTSTLANITNELKITVPEINKCIQDTTNRFNTTLTQFSNEVATTLELNQEVFKSQCNLMKDTSNKINNSVVKTVNEMNQGVTDVTKNISVQLTTIVEQMEEIFKNKVEQLDETLKDELSKSLRTLGEQLATISNKFAEDYTPLAEKLREIVRISEGVM
jgi:ABC-type transporter Mla subunit MlaD